ncbi:MAG: UDP-2,3-diacylglucosamine diphosphatase LpxI [Pirellulaceae bacterium]|nr:UDP-2,3-diacylglucosamine diphosphatase LpxI [Pirellulaceae bacterium]
MAGTSSFPDPPVRMGLLAGWGDYPFVVADALQQQGIEVIGVGIRGHVEPALKKHCQVYRELAIGRLGAAIRFMKHHRVTAATMAGKVHKTKLFRPGAWGELLPDWEALRAFGSHWITGTGDRRDDTLIMAAVDAFARHGIQFAPATDFVPELLIEEGVLVGRLSRWQRMDVEFGWQHAKQLGGLDIGQTVVVKRKAVLAVEAIEGTDRCIERAGELCPSGGFTVVKVAKPKQDMRFDVPTIGIGTMRQIAEAGGRVLAVEAERTILIDKAATLDFARRHRITLVACRADECATKARAA